MANTSATGGYLLESGPTTPIYDQSLRRFIHDVIVGITDLPNELVRQRWNENPAAIPNINVDWMAFGVSVQRPDNDSFQRQVEDELFYMTRVEQIDISCSFYGPNTEYFAGVLRDGFYLTQNTDVLATEKMCLIGFSEFLHVPELVNDRYYDRTDLTFTLNRTIRKEYPVLSFLGADGEIIMETNGKEIKNDF